MPDLEVLRRGLEIAWKDLGVTGEQLLSSPEATQLIIAVAVLAIILSAGTGVYIGSRLGHRAAQKELSKPKGSLGVLELDEANDKADRLAIRIKSVLGGASAASISLDALVNLRESGETFLEEVGGLKSKEIAAAKRYIADLQRQLDIIGI